MFNKLLKYIKNDEYLISISNNKIHLYNYKSILDITDNKISLLLNNNKNIIIKGNNIITRKMENKEMILDGDINYIEIK